MKKSRKAICHACMAKEQGVKSRIAFRHTCGDDYTYKEKAEALDEVDKSGFLSPIIEPALAGAELNDKQKRIIDLSMEIESMLSRIRKPIYWSEHVMSLQMELTKLMQP